MSDDGTTKDDVKLPDGEVGDKINKLFTDEGKDISKSSWLRVHLGIANVLQTSSSLPPWVRSAPLRPRRLPAVPTKCFLPS